ncbi:MAG: hypothetical protein HWE09_02360 [Cyclobacteriaceae bacterium]|nr:hypothetical protein [Cyclobacteriaceae bacterium]
MLHFFRTIRKKLIEQDKVRNYIWYALGEIFLVMIGILLALQVNNWNSERLDRKTSIEYHKRMVYDIDVLVKRLEDESVRASAINKNLSQTVLILEKGEFNDSTAAIVDFALTRYFQITAFSFQIASYEEMKATGQLALIDNLELRQKLYSYAIYASTISSIVDQFTRNVNSGDDLFNKYIRLKIENQEQNSIIEYDLEAISGDPVFINTLSKLSYNWDSYLYFTGTIITQLQKLREDIQQELSLNQPD